MPRRLLSLAAAAVLALAGVEGALAAWAVSASGTSRAGAAVLAPPGAAAVTWDPVVHVSWTPAAGPGATGHRVYRSVASGGPYTAVADADGAASASQDDDPGAGTHYYAVRAVRGDWVSALSTPAARSDPTYVFTGTGATTGTCPTAAAGTFSMRQGASVAGGTQLKRRRSDGGFAFCTDAFSSGQSLTSGTSTLNAYVSNTNGASCTITATLRVNGTTLLGSGTIVVTTGTTRLVTGTLATAAHSFATGDRLQLDLSWQPVNACNDTWLSWNDAASPSRLVLTG